MDVWRRARGGERESSKLVAGLQDGVARVQLLVDRTGCWSFTEPKLGRGPRISIVVGDAKRIDYRDPSSDGSTGGMYGVWRYRPEIQGQLPEGGKGS